MNYLSEIFRSQLISDSDEMESRSWQGVRKLNLEKSCIMRLALFNLTVESWG